MDYGRRSASVKAATEAADTDHMREIDAVDLS